MGVKGAVKREAFLMGKEKKERRKPRCCTRGIRWKNDTLIASPIAFKPRE
jgi:hypothetical protein